MNTMNAKGQANKSAYGAQSRVMQRRRRLACARRGHICGRARNISIVAAFCVVMIFSLYIGAHGASMNITGSTSSVYAAEETVYESVVVHSGDTIWGIASKYTEPSDDIRQKIQEICEYNGVSAGNIYPGEILAIPVPAHLA